MLRSIRFGEADRILHLYTPARGRVNAIAKGARKPKSRFGGRLEPFFRIDMVLYEGRGELLTVTSAATVDGHARLRRDGAAIAAAARGCEAVLRLFDSIDPNPAAYNLLCRYLTMLDSGRRELSDALAFRLKLALVAGFAPELAACALCGEREELSGFSGAAGGVVCGACEGSGFGLSAAAHEFMVAVLSRPLSDTPAAEPRTLRQAERAISDTLEHHAHVRLGAAA